MIPLIAGAMRNHQAIFLEEPADSSFKQMLSDKLSVEDYLRGIDVEYPEFSRGMCYLLRELKENELTEDLTSWPHLRDELNCIHMTHRLSLNDCRNLYPQIRHADTRQAHQVVQAYLST